VYLAFEKNGAQLVLASALLTLVVTVALTIYAFTTSSDFKVKISIKKYFIIFLNNNRNMN